MLGIKNLEKEVDNQINQLLSKTSVSHQDLHDFANFVGRRTKMNIRANLYKYAQCSGGNVFLDTKELDGLMEGYSSIPEGSVLSIIRGKTYFYQLNTGKKYPTGGFEESVDEEKNGQLKFYFT